jgi:steroid 5-alpha reductase family enzyme
MSFLALAATGLAAALLAFSVLWIVSLRLQDASIADPFWGPGFLVVTVVYLVVHGDPSPRGLLVTGLVAAWAARLGLHLLTRNRAEGEDPRYAAMRARGGASFAWSSLFTVFWLQAAILWVVSLPVLGAIAGTVPLGPLDALGAAVFLGGFFTEAIADAQLVRFRADPANRGRILDSGLWRYSRHPNYFGDAVLWWGIYLLAVAAGAAWTVVGPALMTFLLLRVSGVTLLERGLRERKPGYDAYARRTSAFVPWPPRR